MPEAIGRSRFCCDVDNMVNSSMTARKITIKEMNRTEPGWAQSSHYICILILNDEEIVIDYDQKKLLY